MAKPHFMTRSLRGLRYQQRCQPPTSVRGFTVGYDEAISLNELGKANRKCRRGCPDKDFPTEWFLHSTTKTKRLKDCITSGKYKPRRGIPVKITRPKPRVAHAPYYGDCVWQQSMCENGVYRDLTQPFLLDNMACQNGKGTDLAVRRVVRFLRRLYSEAPGEPIYGVHLDVKKFFPSTPHEEVRKLDDRVITDQRFIPFLRDIIDNTPDERSKEDINADPFGERGTGLGCRINQLHQVALLDKLDHELKMFCRFYIRYNDDLLILDHSKEIPRRAEQVSKDWLASIGLTMTVKERFKAQSGFLFLRKRFIVTETGKVIIRLHKDALSDERKALRALKEKMLRGEVTMDRIRAHYQSVISYFEYAGDAPIRAMDKFYTELFRERPKYKRKGKMYGNQKN